MTILQHYWTHRKFGERGLAAGPACGEARAHPLFIINYVNRQRYIFRFCSTDLAWSGGMARKW